MWALSTLACALAFQTLWADLVGIDADDVERVEIAELISANECLQFAAEHQMQKLFLPVLPGSSRLPIHLWQTPYGLDQIRTI